ncbi:MAG: transglutaminase-like domain-containing protein [Thermodesulfobacteriota bacterium]
MHESMDNYLTATPILDADNPEVVRLARQSVGTARGPVEMAVRLYYVVRDGIWYDPYVPFYKPEHYRASHTLEVKRGYCVSKAALLCALGRACGIPSRLGFADVRNHLATRQLIERMGTDIFVYHGFTEFFLDGRWVKATPAFNKELCERHRVPPLEFDGTQDSVFQPYNQDKRRFMEYVRFHGSFPDVPVARIVSAWEDAYGREKVRSWIEAMEKAQGRSLRDFYREDLLED